MDVLCAQCETVYELDDALVPAKGRRVKCTVCGAIFRAFPPQSVQLPPAPVRSETVELELARTQVSANPLEVTVRAPWPEPEEAPPSFIAPTVESVSRDELAAPVEEPLGDNPTSEITKTWTRPAPVEPVASEELAPRPTAPEIRAALPETKLSVFPEDFSPSFEADAPKPKPSPRRSSFEDTAALQASIQAAGRKGLWKIALILIVLAGASYLFYVQVWPSKYPNSLTKFVQANEAPLPSEPVAAAPIDAGQEEVAVVEPAAPVEEPLPDAGLASDAGELEAKAEPTAAPAVPEEPSIPETPPLHLSLRLVPKEKLPKGKIVPKSFVAFMAVAEQKRFDTNYKLALQNYSKAAGMASHRVEPLAGRGLALLGLGKLAEAEAIFKRALKVNKKYVPAMLGLAESYRLQGNTQLAIKQFQGCLDVTSSGPEADTARNALAALRHP